MPSSDLYPGKPLPIGPLPAVKRNRTIPDVVDSFSRLAEDGDYLAFHPGNCFPRRKYTKGATGGQRTNIHFQGVQRLRDERFLVVSGGDNVEDVSQLFLLELRTPFAGSLTRADGPAYGANLLRSKTPDVGDCVVSVFAVDGKINANAAISSTGDFFWHGGGLSRLGDIVAIPVEATTESRILFVNFSQPEHPSLCGTPIERRGVEAGKAGAVALVQMDDGRFLCGVWSDSDDKAKREGPRLDLYLSQGTSFEFPTMPSATWHYRDLDLPHRKMAGYQSVAILQQDDGQLFLLGTENTAAVAPGFGGTQIADLFYLDRRRIVTRANDMMSFVSSRTFVGRGEQFDMDAAAGIYVDNNGRLLLYAGYHWRVNGRVQLIEFAPEYRLSDPMVRSAGEGWIELYEDKEFRGRRVRLYGWRPHTRISDFDNCFARRKKFGDKTSSVRYQLPPGKAYRLYRRTDFKQSSNQPSHVDLIGNGHVREIPDLDRFELNDEVRSARML